MDLDYLDAVDEIRFTNLVFTLHPKSIDTWAYRCVPLLEALCRSSVLSNGSHDDNNRRRWLAIRLIAAMTSDEARERFLDEQIGVCERLAEQKPRNYHAWSFRHWVVTKFATDDELRGELKRMNKWCETHITDHSGWNHRQHTVNQLLRRSSPDERSLVLKEEYELLSGIMALYPTHEALWCHRRFIIHLLLRQYEDQKPLLGQEAARDADVVAVCQRIKDMERRVASTGATPATQYEPSSSTEGLEINGMGTAALCDAWRSIQLDLFGDTNQHGASSTVPQPPGRFPLAMVASICVREIEVAWRCESKYARRYAAWCLARLRAWASASLELGDALDGLSSTCRKLLAVEDATLQDLWESNTVSVGVGS